jgi:mRNA-degrading endonuclease toxin of MazEF toxin-antitoxin module
VDNKATVAQITTKGKGYPTEVTIDQKANLPKPSFIQADNLHTVSKNVLAKYVGTRDAHSGWQFRGKSF